MISIKIIARHLNIRSERILRKAQKLDVEVLGEDGIPSLKLEGAKRLVLAYFESNRVQSNTRENAHAFLNVLKDFKDGQINQTVMSQPIVKKSNANMKFKQYRASKLPVQTGSTKVIKVVLSVLKLSVQSLESLYFKFIALFVAIGVQMHHSAVWFYRSSPEGAESWPSAIGFAIMYDLFILVVTMEGRTQLAKGFSVLTFISNLLFFEPWIDFDGTVRSYTRTISSIMISAIIAFILYAYTEIFVKYRTVQNLNK